LLHPNPVGRRSQMAREIKGTITISVERCKGCGLCTIACTLDLLKLSNTRLNANGYHPVEIETMNDCIGCGNCFQMCPDYAITVKRIVQEGARYGQNINERQ